MPVSKSTKDALAKLQSGELPVLGLQYANVKPSPGEKVPRANAKSKPTLSVASLPEGTYFVVAIDIDAPFVSLPILGPILHWIQSDLKPKPAADGSLLLETDTPFVANYIGPAPPPGSGPHRYVFLLYAQPEGFKYKDHAPQGGKELGNSSRMFHNLEAFEKKVGLGPVLAANYFLSN